MSDNTKLKKVIRARQAETGETYSTARMHILSALPARRRAARTIAPEGPPKFYYQAHGPDGLPTGKVVLTGILLPGAVMACDSCGWFSPQSMVRSARCATPACKGSIYEWLHPDRVEVLHPSIVDLSTDHTLI